MEPVPTFGGACVRAAEDNCRFFSWIACMPIEIDCRGEFWSAVKFGCTRLAEMI
jgi:hypothetical protein